MAWAPDKKIRALDRARKARSNQRRRKVPAPVALIQFGLTQEDSDEFGGAFLVLLLPLGLAFVGQEASIASQASKAVVATTHQGEKITFPTAEIFGAFVKGGEKSAS